MKWLLLLPLLLAACAPASTGRDVAALQEQVAVLQARVNGLDDKMAEEKTRSCKALYLSFAAMVKVGVAEDRSLEDALPGCQPWKELGP